MRNSFSSHEQYNVADADLQEDQINGGGGAQAPVLVLPVRIDFHIHPTNPRVGMRFVALQGRLVLDHQQIGAAPAVNVNIQLHSGFKALSDRLYYLEFPLDAARVAFIERARAGGDLKVQVKLAMTVEKLFALQEPPIPCDAVWGIVNRAEIHLQQDITILQSAWVSRVLPQIGHGVVHLVELPAIPLSAVESFKDAFQSLRQAQEHHKNGLYDEAVAKCRVALERFFDYPEITGPDKLTRRVPTLKKSWETKLGKATYDWLSSSFSAIKRASNAPHHGPGPHYDQFESQMLVAITIAVVAYAAKHEP